MRSFFRLLLVLPAIGLIRIYQILFRSITAGVCRFEPSCSEYAIQALQQHGLGRGLWLTGKRLARCHPWHPGGYDPVP